MTTITTVRAAMRAVASEGWNPASRYQLGSAMGPAKLYVLCLASGDGCSPLQSGDGPDRQWLLAFTQTDPLSLNVGRGLVRQIRYQELTGTELLDLACRLGSGLLLDAGGPNECRIQARDLQSLHVAASYAEAIAGQKPAAAATLAMVRAAATADLAAVADPSPREPGQPWRRARAIA